MDKVAGIKKVLMVFQKPVEDIVGMENVVEIFQAAKYPISFVPLDNADHLVTKREDAGYVAEVESARADRHIV